MTRTIRRIPKEECWDRAAVEEVMFTPWMIKEMSAKVSGAGAQGISGHRDQQGHRGGAQATSEARGSKPTKGSTSRRLWSSNLVEPMDVLVAQPLCSAVPRAY